MIKKDKALQALLRLRRLKADGARQTLHSARNTQDAATKALDKLDQIVTQEIARAESGTLAAWRPGAALRRTAIVQALGVAQDGVLAASEDMKQAASALLLAEDSVALRRLQQRRGTIARQQRELDDCSAHYPTPGASTPRRI